MPSGLVVPGNHSVKLGDWAQDYCGEVRVVYGHTPVAEVRWTNSTININTGCVFGGRLTALRHPECGIVVVETFEPYPETAQSLHAALSWCSRSKATLSIRACRRRPWLCSRESSSSPGFCTPIRGRERWRKWSRFLVSQSSSAHRAPRIVRGSAAHGAHPLQPPTLMKQNTKYYAVRAGYTPGIYDNWSDCQKQTSGYSGAEFKSFQAIEPALEYLHESTKGAVTLYALVEDKLQCVPLGKTDLQNATKRKALRTLGLNVDVRALDRYEA